MFSSYLGAPTLHKTEARFMFNNKSYTGLLLGVGGELLAEIQSAGFGWRSSGGTGGRTG